jgi:Na+-translocating ferredoxin:NAD+ oxidoreductase RNF subunit RnfB
MSRRGLFEALVRPFGTNDESVEPISAESEVSKPTEAIIQGRFCLAYQGTTCFTCSERCPEPGAITLDKGIPTVYADLCTGCGICHDLCPAPCNAILMLAKPDAE